MIQFLIMPLIISKSKSWEMFNQIASRYDVINRILSLGVDVYWRKKLLSLISFKKNIQYLDMATGTGDVFYAVMNAKHNILKGIGMDLSEGMLKQAQNKLSNHQGLIRKKCEFRLGDAGDIPLEKASLDLVTIAFGIRNVPDTEKCLSEFYRVLGPKGKCLILEFSLPKSRVIKSFYLFYLRHLLPKIGKMLSGHQEAYSYLNKTIEEFPYGEDFKSLMMNAGFRVDYTPLSFGIVTLYQGHKD